MKRMLLTYEGPATGLSPKYAIVANDKTMVQEPTNEGVAELVPGSGCYGVSIPYHMVAGAGTVVIWTPENGEMGAIEGPWDKWESGT